MNLNHDSITNELDNKTSSLSKLEVLCQNLKAQNDDLTNKLSSQLNKSNIDSQRIFERESEIKQLKQNLL
jgi:hypothetical protein